MPSPDLKICESSSPERGLYEILTDPDTTVGAYTETLTLLRKRLTYVARKRVPDEAVSDIVQETLAILFQKLPRLRPGVEVLPYTFLILRKVIGNYYQRQKTMKKVHFDTEREASHNPVPEMEGQIYLTEVMEKCAKVNGEFAVIVKMVLDGYSLREIAREVGAPTIHALYCKLYRGRRQLKEILDRSGDRKKT